MTRADAPDPIAILLAEHRMGIAQFDALDAAIAAAANGPAGAAAAGFLEAVRTTLAYLDDALELHIRKEEEPLFPRLKAALPADDRLIDEMVAEHDQARLKREDLRAVLDDLLGGHDDVRQDRAALHTALNEAAASADPAAWERLRRAGRDVLRTLRVHFQNEEEIVFPLAPELLPAAELAAAGWEMVAMDAGTDDEPGAADAPSVGVAVHLTEAAQLLRSSPELARDGRTARTLLKDGPLRVVLVALAAGGKLQEHPAPGPTTVHALTGRATLRAGGAAHALLPGVLVALAAGEPHAVDAAEETTLLLTISLPR